MPLPTPIYLIPYNFLPNLTLIHILATNPHIPALDAARKPGSQDVVSSGRGTTYPT
ncbi:hypothetical protein BDW22DRAFT_1363255 [Trametopsis cervina]|nr:hypothetical protein BDW22DRAFT_1363255 [Trametopsis cervina]